MDAFLVDGIRTPIGNFGGTLSTVRTDDLAAHSINELLIKDLNLYKGKSTMYWKDIKIPSWALSEALNSLISLALKYILPLVIS